MHRSCVCFQRGNPLLKSILNVPWEYEEMVPDYVMGRTTCALFLSLRYHNLNPDYINERLKQLGKQYELRVLLVQVHLASRCKMLFYYSVFKLCAYFIGWLLQKCFHGNYQPCSIPSWSSCSRFFNHCNMLLLSVQIAVIWLPIISFFLLEIINSVTQPFLGQPFQVLWLIMLFIFWQCS